MKAMVRSVGAYVPERVMTNEELSHSLDTSDEWIVSKTGIRRRHIASDDEATSDLALRAARIALERANLEADDIDLVLVAACTPDHLSFPSTASIVQHRLGAHRAGAMDLSAACTGFIYALETASMFVKGGNHDNILVIGADIMTRTLDWHDRGTCVLFGDAAGAVVVSRNETDSPSDIVSSFLRSDGSGADALLRPVGGTRNPYTFDSSDDVWMRMNGRKVYTFAVRVLVEAIETTLRDNDLHIDDIAYVVPHQANHRIIAAASSRSRIPLEKFYVNVQEYANTSAASIPLALNAMHEQELLERGTYLLFIGFGGGLTYGANLVRY